MAGLVKRITTDRNVGEVPGSTVECVCGWVSSRFPSRVAAVAQHKTHVSDDCPIGRR
jgi:hypothetical protein